MGNILVIGNGFDLEHHLPTTYGDFLDFMIVCNEIKKIPVGNTPVDIAIRNTVVSKKYYKDSGFSKNLEKLIEYFNEHKELKKKFNNPMFIMKTGSEGSDYKFEFSNYWISYFIDRRKCIGEGWIDFEKEILEVLKKIEFNHKFYDYLLFDILQFYVERGILDNIKIIGNFFYEHYDVYCEDDVNKAINEIYLWLKDEENDGNAFYQWLRDRENDGNNMRLNTIYQWLEEKCEDEYIDAEEKEKYEEVKIIIDRIFDLKELTEIEKNCNVKEYDLYDKEIYLEEESEYEFEKRYGSIIKYIVENLENDLNEFIKYFELYLKEIFKVYDITSSKIIEKLDIDKVLSFNYTDTYSAVYDKDKDKKTEVSYIHGKVRDNVKEGQSNIVLGVDEYLDEDKKNSDLKFIKFKKYFQRIHKQTGCEYKNWLNDKNFIGETNTVNGFGNDQNQSNANTIYFFGHSLDTTDKDILKELIESPYFKIEIFYFNEEHMAQQITNLVKIIGQDKLIEYTYSANKKIKFTYQYDIQ